MQLVDPDLYFAGAGSELQYANISCNYNTDTMSVSSAAYTQVTDFDTDSASNGAVPDHTNDHITVEKSGVHLISLAMCLKNSAGVGHNIDVEVKKNNGTSDFDNLHTNRTLGMGSDVGALAIAGIAALSAGDTVELWVTSDSELAKDITVVDASLSVVLIGGV